MNIADEQLLKALKGARLKERELVLMVLKYLIAVEERNLHLQLGYSSLYSFCTGELNYSEDEAYIRIQAMRLMKVVPKIEEKIESGRLSLTVAAKAQTISRRKEKEKQALSTCEKEQVLESLLGKSVRAAEKTIASQFPEVTLPKEKIRPITDELTKIEFTARNSLVEKLEKLKGLLAHKNFDGRLDGLIEEIADIALSKLDRTKVTAERPVAQPVTPTRYIRKHTERKVWQRAGHHCEYVDPTSGRRCDCRHGLQIDHVIEFSIGGSNDFENLQLLCGAHNRWRSSAWGINS